MNNNMNIGYGLEDRGFDSRQGFFFFASTSITFLGPSQSPIQWILRALFPGIKR